MAEDARKTELDDKALRQIKEQIGNIRNGSVIAVIHAGKIVQLDTNVKVRLNHM